jgi:hypothetical protein
MICSLGDPITLSGIRSHRQAEVAGAWVAFVAGLRRDGAVSSCGDVLGAPGMKGQQQVTGLAGQTSHVRARSSGRKG